MEQVEIKRKKNSKANGTNGKEANGSDKEQVIILKYDGVFLDDVFTNKKRWNERRWLAKLILSHDKKVQRVFADRNRDKYDVSFLALREGDMLEFACDIIVRRRFVGRIMKIEGKEIEIAGEYQYEQIE